MKSLFAAFALAAVAASLQGCSNANPTLVATVNTPASLPTAGLPADPLDWQVLTSFVDPKNATMSTLYGNDVAIRYARATAGRDYPGGSRLALVTWRQREDPRWFGANIPGQLQSVEFVSVAQASLEAGSALPAVHAASPQPEVSYSYQRFQGSPLTLTASASSSQPEPRVAYLLSLPPSLFP